MSTLESTDGKVNTCFSVGKTNNNKPVLKSRVPLYRITPIKSRRTVCLKRVREKRTNKQRVKNRLTKTFEKNHVKFGGHDKV